MTRSPLAAYRGKRDFARTPEPAGQDDGGAGSRFVVHKHHATADHYDLRLELDGVLRSWAVPKGPSLDPAEKRFAVETEDHPVAYLDFEGVIPAGQYGAGPMIVWDAGTWAPMGDPAADLAKGAFKFRLAGEKLSGGWMLARLKRKDAGDRQGWLLIKEHDQAAVPDRDILQERPESVQSGRRVEELVASAPPGKRPPPRPGRLKGAIRRPPPAALVPQLATPAARPPDGEDWLHEIKIDGYRTLARIDGGGVRLVTRGGLDWTHRYGDLPAAFAALPVKQAVIDGEIAVHDADGVSRLALLQQALSDGASSRLMFHAFDLLHLDGWDLTQAGVEARKGLLARILAGQGAAAPIRYCDHITGNGGAFFDRASEMGLEGVISKRRAAPYRPGRDASWIKAKALQTGDFLIAGYTSSPQAGGLAALALAEAVDDEINFVGKVGTGFDRDQAKALLARLDALRDPEAAIQGLPRDVIPVRPVLAAHVQYATRTASGALRHATYRGLREVTFAAPSQGAVPRLVSDADLAAVWVTNPERRLFGRAGATKLDVALYYARIGDAMLPHLFGRPVSLVRCPSGRSGDCFFQRHPFTGMPPSVGTIETRSSDGELRTYLSIEDVRSYLALAQFGVIEFHTWGSVREHLETPDRVTFDLDPGEGVPWREVIEAALHVRVQLEALGLVPFVKTTGGKGLHVLVPVRPGPDWKAVHAATGAIAAALVASAPEVFITSMAVERRTRRIFIDIHRNGRGATAVAPYSLRARANLPVSTPVAWSDLDSVDAPGDLNYSTVPGLVSAFGDPWSRLDRSARDLPKVANLQ